MANTYTGSMETNNPLFVISVPEELRSFPIYKLLQMNSRNLQTIFDTRATLLDILKVRMKLGQEEPKMFSINLKKTSKWLISRKFYPMVVERLF